ncbi:1,6-anhydro-N-acetylmuramyl-L-alanine amidase AmpD [Thalassotalea ganghwensis]
MDIINGWLQGVKHEHSPHFDVRPNEQDISLLVIHNISLPPKKFGGPYITDLFLGRLNPNADEYFTEIYQLKVSAHCLIRRDGEVIQYVSFNHRAWHAGVSNYRERQKCNDFSIGIELEGADDIPYTDEQYHQLALVSQAIKAYYPEIKDHIVGHCDIAPDRKTDPGEAFDWHYYQTLLSK